MAVNRSHTVNLRFTLTYVTPTWTHHASAHLHITPALCLCRGGYPYPRATCLPLRPEKPVAVTTTVLHTSVTTSHASSLTIALSRKTLTTFTASNEYTTITTGRPPP